MNPPQFPRCEPGHAGSELRFVVVLRIFADPRCDGSAASRQCRPSAATRTWLISTRKRDPRRLPVSLYAADSERVDKPTGYHRERQSDQPRNHRRMVFLSGSIQRDPPELRFARVYIILALESLSESEARPGSICKPSRRTVLLKNIANFLT